jgi:hypothetical protein
MFQVVWQFKSAHLDEGVQIENLIFGQHIEQTLVIVKDLEATISSTSCLRSVVNEFGVSRLVTILIRRLVFLHDYAGEDPSFGREELMILAVGDYTLKIAA